MDPISAILIIVVVFLLLKRLVKGNSAKSVDSSQAPYQDEPLQKLWGLAFDPNVPGPETVSTIGDYQPQIPEEPLQEFQLTDLPIDPYANLPAVDLPRVG